MDVLDRLVLFLAAVALITVAAVPAALAQGGQPFGQIGQLEGHNAGSGVIALAGWALDDDGVESVDVLVDGVIVGRALYGSARPDVALAHPGFPDSANAGFVYELDTTRFLNGLHVVGGVIHSASGQRQFIPPVVLQWVNSTAVLEPFGEFRLPLADAELFGNCDFEDPDRRLTVVRGWALDVGVSQHDTGVGYVELLLDGTLLANSKVDCHHSAVTGGWTNCYGLRDFGLEQVFPGVFNASHAGLRFVLDVGALIAFGHSEGAHHLTLRSGDIADQVRVIDTLPVTFRCDDDLNEDGFGSIDLPVEGGFFGGVVMVTGWALDRDGVDRVVVRVDGALVGEATHGFSRPEVAADYPGLPDSASAGWSFALDTRDLAEGHHQLQVLVIDDLGHSTLIGSRPFLVANAPTAPSLGSGVGVAPQVGPRRAVGSDGGVRASGGSGAEP